MPEINHQQNRDANFRKLGIREIQERLEVSPLLTDPGTADLSSGDPGGKSYGDCSIAIGLPWDFIR